MRQVPIFDVEITGRIEVVVVAGTVVDALARFGQLGHARQRICSEGQYRSREVDRTIARGENSTGRFHALGWILKRSLLEESWNTAAS